MSHAPWGSSASTSSSTSSILMRPATTMLPSACRSTVGLFHVELVDDLAHQLFEQVLQGDQAGRAPVLVDDHGQVDLAVLHLGQEGGHALGLGDEVGRPHVVADRLGPPALVFERIRSLM